MQNCLQQSHNVHQASEKCIFAAKLLPYPQNNHLSYQESYWSKVFVDAIKKMVDHSCSEDIENDIVECAKKNPNTLGIEHIQTREFGNKIYVDLKVLADESITLAESDKIAEEIHDCIEREFPKIKHIAIMMKPTRAIKEAENTQ